MNDIGLMKKYFSLKIHKITVVKLKTLAKQRDIKGYYKLRKSELIQKFNTGVRNTQKQNKISEYQRNS